MKTTNSKINIQKKRVKKPRNDWHREDVKAALRKLGWPLCRLSVEYGYAPRSAGHVLAHTWPQIERIIADILKMQPWEIWPSRYNDYGEPIQDGNPNMVRLKKGGRPRNVNVQKAD